ncbi:MAG: asparagine synthetase B, partial [Clostridiales bacterium]|nr:asparagine synthetase B [Clostridiales bacterium]
MCGIAGFCNWNRDNTAPCWREAAERMGDVLAHRGPDDEGLFLSPVCALAHQRLAVIDPEHGQQPMTGGHCTLVYNGELYNTPDLRLELERRGHVFRTNTDTEVVLEGYLEYGAAVSGHLEGIYAFAIWDQRKGQLFCCRDRFGVKPFFYAVQGDTFLFGSEPKALFAYGLEPK